MQLVTRICRHASEGFDILLAHNRPDLTVEQLVVDAARPYRDLFGAQIRELSSQRLEEFPHADGTAQPLPGAVSSSAPVSSGSRGHKTTTVSQKDIDAGLVRIRIGPTKDRFPASPQNIRIVLRGRELTCWWNPRFNHDRERLGLIRIGTQATRDLLTAGEGLEVRFRRSAVRRHFRGLMGA